MMSLQGNGTHRGVPMDGYIELNDTELSSNYSTWLGTIINGGK
jgi:hypothetical protein